MIVRWRVRLKKEAPKPAEETPRYHDGGEWWTAVLAPRFDENKAGRRVKLSPMTVPEILCAFREGRVGGVLYEAVAKPEEDIQLTDQTYDGKQVIRIRLRYPPSLLDARPEGVRLWGPREPVDICLSELGIELLDQVT